MNRRIHLSDIQGNITIDDFILIKNILESFDEANHYELQYKEHMQSQLGTVMLANESNMYQDIFKD